jgi:hypothetical protein
MKKYLKILFVPRAIVVTVFLVAPVLPSQLAADSIIGSSSTGTNPSSVFTVNENTGLATLVGASGLGNKLSAIDIDPVSGVVYAIRGSACSGARLVTIAGDGSATIVGVLTGSGFDGTSTIFCDGGSDSLAFAPDGTLYAGGWNGGTNGPKFLRVDKITGAVLANLPTGGHLTGLAFDAAGTLWASRGGTGEDRIHTVNTASGAFLTTLFLSENLKLSGLAFAPDGTLYGSVPDQNRLVTINTTTGFVTNVGGFGAAVSKISGLTHDLIIEVDIDIKFCSNPNAHNCRSGGVLPVTIFGSADLDVADIDLESLQLCNDNGCTDPGLFALGEGDLRDWSFADRGTPGDSGFETADCTIIEDPIGSGIFEEVGNPDGFADLDAAFDKRAVSDLLDVCDTGSKGDSSLPLFIQGSLLNGTPILSTPVFDDGIDQLVRQNR